MRKPMKLLKPSYRPRRPIFNLLTEISATDVFVSRQININPLRCRGNYSGTSNDMKLVHWPLMGGLLHLVQRRGGDWAGPQPAQGLLAVPNVTVHPSTASVLIIVLL